MKFEGYVDDVPHITQDQRDACLRLIAAEPDFTLLRDMLGLTPHGVPKPLSRRMCPTHEVQRKYEQSSGHWRCPECRRAANRISKRRARERRRSA